MPLYDFVCDKCGVGKEASLGSSNDSSPPCPKCDVEMRRKISRLAMVRIDGKGYPSRRKWAENWTPDSPPFSTGSLHGERY